MDDLATPNGIFPSRDTRSVSATLHDRSHNSGSSALSAMPVTTAISKRSASKPRTSRVSGGSSTSNLTAALQQPARPQSAFEQRNASLGHHGSTSSTSSSPPSGSARETFLNYFFGQNGPGPIAGASVETSRHGMNGHHGHGHSHALGMGSVEPAHIVPTGRDTTVGESSLTTGLMAGKRPIDGNNAAYDMKSLGKHIEAVSIVAISFGWDSVSF